MLATVKRTAIVTAHLSERLVCRTRAKIETAASAATKGLKNQRNA